MELGRAGGWGQASACGGLQSARRRLKSAPPSKRSPASGGPKWLTLFPQANRNCGRHQESRDSSRCSWTVDAAREEGRDESRPSRQECLRHENGLIPNSTTSGVLTSGVRGETNRCDAKKPGGWLDRRAASFKFDPVLITFWSPSNRGTGSTPLYHCTLAFLMKSRRGKCVSRYSLPCCWILLGSGPCPAGGMSP